MSLTAHPLCIGGFHQIFPFSYKHDRFRILHVLKDKLKHYENANFNPQFVPQKIIHGYFGVVYSTVMAFGTAR